MIISDPKVSQNMELQPVSKALQNLNDYVNMHGLESHDHYDLMSTSIGKLARRGYYQKNRLLFSPLAAVVYGLDLLAPGIPRMICHKSISAEAISYFARAKFDMYAQLREERFLEEAKQLTQWLKDNSIKGYSVSCWGLPFDWQTSADLIPENTPCVTITTMAALLMLDAACEFGIEEFKEVGNSAVIFIMNDLNRCGCRVSYTPLDYTFVLNANAYAASILIRVGHSLQNHKMLAMGEDIVEDLLKAQGRDGSLPYYYSDKTTDAVNFIDCLHSCFVIESLLKVNLYIKSSDVVNAIKLGVGFLVDQFIGEDGSCRHYLNYHSPHYITADARSCAEAIRCLSLVDEVVPGSLDVAEKIAFWTIDNMQLKNGSFRHRRHRVPSMAISYHRWSNGPMLAALALLNRRLSERMNGRSLDG